MRSPACAHALASISCALALACFGCALGPRYRRPATQVTATYRGQDRAEAASFADLPWWDAFGDDALAALINEALQNNYDLKDAAARVDIALENAHLSTDALLPALGLQASPSYQQVFSGFSFPGVPRSNFNFGEYRIEATLSWEIDLWGRLRRLREAALAQFFESQDNRRGVIVSLIGDVGASYFNLLSLDLQLEIARRTVVSRRETLALFATREAGGVGDRLQTASEEALLAGAAATIPELERQIVATENQMCILLGRPPGPIRRGGGLMQRRLPAHNPAGMPSALLERRPDVRAAEARLIAANAQVGAAFAAFFPQLSGDARVGFASSSLADLFTEGAFTYGASLLLSWIAPVLNGASRFHEYRAQEANWRANVAEYRRAVLVALAETSDALVTIDRLREVRAQLEIAVKTRIESVELAKVRYTNGVASYLDVVQAEQNLFPTEIQLAQTVGAQFTAMTQLYRALGGGWQTSEPQKRSR